MTNVTIDDLLDGEAVRTASSQGILQQAGLSFKGTIQSNPPRMFPAINQAQLEAELGTDLEIPDGDRLTISINESFTLTKPFKIGLGSLLEIESPVADTTLTYTGSGALFQNTNPVNDITSVIVKNLALQGNGTNSVFDIVGTGIIRAENAQFLVFDSIGTGDIPFYLFNQNLFSFINEGLTMRNPERVGLFRSTVFQGGVTNFTLFSIIAGVPQVVLLMDESTILQGFAGDSLIFLDPNSPVGSRYVLIGLDSLPGDLFQQGVELDVPFVQNDGSGNARFVTTISHNLEVGDVVVLSGFAETTYNKTAIVTNIFSSTQFDVAEIAFVTTSAGKMNTTSIDNTDVRVDSQRNQGTPNSMFTADAGLEIFGAEITSSSLAQDAFEVITSASWAFSNLERFEVDVNNEGKLKALDPELRRYSINYGGTIEKSGGGSVNIGVVLLKNGAVIGFNAPHTVNTGKIQITRGDIVELTKDDTIQVAVINYDASATAIIISQISMVVNLA